MSMRGAPTPRAGALSTATDWAGVALRVAYFAVAPFFVALFALFFSVTPLFINLGLTFLVFFLAEYLRTHAHRGTLLRRLLRRQIALVNYYRERAPRPFLYYVLFPLMAPYWLVSRDARREFRLYRRFVFANLVLLVAFRAWEYQAVWSPDIPLKRFLALAANVLFLQLCFVILFAVPTVVTVIDCELRGRMRRLWLYGGVAALSSFVVVLGYRSSHSVTAPIAVCARARERTLAAPERARAAQRAALDAAEAHAGEGHRERRRVGEELLGPPRAAARAALETVYKPDEAACFRVFSLSEDGDETLVLRAEGPVKKTGPIWLAKRAGRKGEGMVEDADKLPGGASALFDVLR